MFGGTRRVPLRGAFRVTVPATVSITVLRGSRVVTRFATTTRTPDRTFRFRLPSGSLRRGVYRVRLQAAGDERQATATLSARRL